MAITESVIDVTDVEEPRMDSIVAEEPDGASIFSEDPIVCDDPDDFTSSRLSDLPSNAAFTSHTGRFKQISSPTVPASGQFGSFKIPPPRLPRHPTVIEVPDEDDMEFDGKLCEAPAISVAILAFADLQLKLPPKRSNGKGSITPSSTHFDRSKIKGQ
ncbi:hypothetical protein K438DRAFT_1989683 [Mycena galopus ATCC 62051]|nr:hypothetical protein K438DRAFT_1989683 [Mycena galopus ATCC 62051]